MNQSLPIIEPPADYSPPRRPASRAGLPRQTELGPHAEDFINDDALSRLLGRPSDRRQVRDVIAKSMAKEPLEVAETAALLAPPIPT